jgi:tRNA(Ile)-lysidine synthetase, N-terminal domain
MAPRFLPAGYGDTRLLAPLRSIFKSLSAGSHSNVAVALSGGADSAMLAVHAALAARDCPELRLHCFHIHHGLLDQADGWQSHVHTLSLGLGIPCHSLRVAVEEGSGKGTEAAAREARYLGFQRLAERTGVSHIFLAHHLNDQAETVLMRLLRGAGPTGLAAMSASTNRGGLVYLRPWLDIDRSVVLQAAERYAEVTGWTPVNDPTNIDDAYTRGALRQRLVPVLDERWPAWRGLMARHARQAKELALLVDEVAASDFQGLEPGHDGRDFSLAAWRDLGAHRQTLVLRYWLHRHGLRAPTEARLNELCKQLRGLHALGHDRQMRMRHENHWIVCEKGRIRLLSINDKDESR